MAMLYQQLINALIFIRLLAGVTAGQTTQTSSAISLFGAESLLFGIDLGAITSTGTVTITVMVSEDGTNFYASDAKLIIDDTGGSKTYLLEIGLMHPKYSHVKLQIERGTANSVINYAWVETASGRRVEPVTQGSGIQSATRFITPMRTT